MNMKKTVALTAVAATGVIAGAAQAGTVTLTFHFDTYATLGGAGYAEASWDVAGLVGTGSDANVNAEMVSDGGTGFFWTTTLDLSNGIYGYAIEDGFGDGWSDAQWGGTVDGTAALTISGDVVGGSIVVQLGDGISNSGWSIASGEFTVIPAPGAIALIGAAGLVARRRRRA